MKQKKNKNHVICKYEIICQALIKDTKKFHDDENRIQIHHSISTRLIIASISKRRRKTCKFIFIIFIILKKNVDSTFTGSYVGQISASLIFNFKLNKLIIKNLSKIPQTRPTATEHMYYTYV